MNIKLLAVALLASATGIANIEAGNHHGNNNGNVVTSRSGNRGASVSSFRSMPVRSFAGNRTMNSSQRFSNSVRFRPNSIASGSGLHQFNGANFNRNRLGQVGNTHGFASGKVIGATNGAGHNQFQNGNKLAPNWRSHVFAQHSATWHRDWDRRSDHWWHGHRCHFFNGSWVIFDFGFSPWWPWWWDYPAYGYGYGYPYDYSYGGYGYGYNDPGYADPGYGNSYVDPGAYDNQGGYDQGGYDQGNNSYSYQRRGYADRSANSSVAAAQDRLKQEGFYDGQIDGVMGPETRHALVRFQTKRGLRISGELTTETLDALGLRQYANY